MFTLDRPETTALEMKQGVTAARVMRRKRLLIDRGIQEAF
jgi:hypothetical protein